MKPLVDLTGKRGTVIGIANAQSIAAGCARPSTTVARDWRRPISTERPSRSWRPSRRPRVEWLAACDVRVPGELEALFERVKSE